MRFTLQEADISINVSLTSLLYDTKATSHITLEDLMLFVRGDVSKYSSVFKSLETFDCGGRTIMEDWVRHVSTIEHRTPTYMYKNKTLIMSKLQTDYSSELTTRIPRIPNLISALRKELTANRRCVFQPYDVLLYRTTISPYTVSTIPSKRYLMQVIVSP